MAWLGVALNENMRVKVCPVCKNEEHVSDAEFCMICGKPVINQCTFALQVDVPIEYHQCTHLEPLPGNARYCPYCGSESTFLENGLLSPWDEPSTPLPF